MQIERIQRRSVSQDVFDRLAQGLLAGEVPPGEALPAERSLTESFGVSRQAVREALQRLGQAGLVQTTHGGATRALDYRSSGSLDLLHSLLIAPDGGIDHVVSRSIMEMRSAIGSDSARIAARRAEPESCNRLTQLVSDMSDAAGDLTLVAELDLAFWDEIVNASGNIAYKLSFNTLRRTYEPLLDVMSSVLCDELSDPEAHRKLADAIVARDPEGAGVYASALLAKGAKAVMRTLEHDEERRS